METFQIQEKTKAKPEKEILPKRRKPHKDGKSHKHKGKERAEYKVEGDPKGSAPDDLSKQ